MASKAPEERQPKKPRSLRERIDRFLIRGEPEESFENGVIRDEDGKIIGFKPGRTIRG